MWSDSILLLLDNSLWLIFALCCYVVPVLQVILLCFMWMKPMRLQSLKRCYVINEILSACSTWKFILWVYVVGVREFLSLSHIVEYYEILNSRSKTKQVLLAIFQLGQISSYMMNESCLSMNQGFQMLVDADMIEEKDAQCFYLHAEARDGSYILLLSAALLCIMNNLVAGAAVQSRIESIEHFKMLFVSTTRLVAVRFVVIPVRTLRSSMDSHRESNSVRIWITSSKKRLALQGLEKYDHDCGRRQIDRIGLCEFL